MGRVELDHDANDVRLVLRRTYVRDTAARHTIVARRHAERRAFEIDDNAIWSFEREVIYFYRRVDSDDDLRPARRRYYAHGPDGRSGRRYVRRRGAFDSDSSGVQRA